MRWALVTEILPGTTLARGISSSTRSASAASMKKLLPAGACTRRAPAAKKMRALAFIDSCSESRTRSVKRVVDHRLAVACRPCTRLLASAGSTASTRIICSRGKRPHQIGVLGAEADQVLGGDEREVHAGLEQEAVRLHELVAVEALGVADEVGDRLCVLGDQDQRRVQGQEAAERGQRSPEARAKEQGRAVDRAAADHHDLRRHPVLAGLPGGGLAVAGALHHRLASALRDPGHPAVGHHLDARRLGGRQLDPVRPLLGRVGAAEVAQARRPAALDVDRELLAAVAEPPAAEPEQAVVVVEPLLALEVDVVLLEVLRGAPPEVLPVEPRHPPPLDHPLRNGQRGAGVDHGRAAVGAAEGQGHVPVPGEDPAVLEVELAGHLHLAAGVLVLGQPGAPLQHHDPAAGARERRELLGHGAAAGARPDDHDVGARLTHGAAPASRRPGRSRSPARPRPARSSP